MEWNPEFFNVGTLPLIFTLSFCGALIQGTMGFGFAIVTAPFMYAINPDFVPVPLIITFIPLGVLMMRKNKEGLSKTIVPSLIAGRIPGTFVGAALLSMATHQTLSLMLGTLVLASVLISVTKISIQANRTNLMVAGFASGVTATAASIGGPPMALVLQNEKGSSVRGNLACVNIVSNAVALVTLFFYGNLRPVHFALAALIFPGILLGLKASQQVVTYMRPDALRPLVLMLCFVSGSVAIFNSF